MVSNLFVLTERRLDRTRSSLYKVDSLIVKIMQQQNETKAHIDIIENQCVLYEQAAELSRDEFFFRQRRKASLLVKVAQLKHKWDNLQNELSEQHKIKRDLQGSMRKLNNRCEKFKKYLKQQRYIKRLKFECQQQYEIEELSYGYSNDKI